MYCLYNGEYGEHDLSFIPGLEKPGGILQEQKKQYQRYKGMVVGDFVCLDVEYDWGKRDQRWKIKCNLCGKERYQYHTNDWRRGKGRSLFCECRKQKKEEEKDLIKAARIIEREQQRKIKERELIDTYKAKYLSKKYDGWVIADIYENGRCKIKCEICGREIERKNIIDVVNGKSAQCRHPKDYSGEEWIGRRNGNLVVVGRVQSRFLAKCDCGNNRIVRPVEMFTYMTANNCGQDNCPYNMKTRSQEEAKKRKIEGSTFEMGIFARLVMQGYDAELVAKTGDFGVDIIITEKDGSRIAIQCKNHKSPTGVAAIQEVYAGGRFYDCTKFAVISYSAYTNNAVIMAKKLGVYLSDENFEYPSDIGKYSLSLLPVQRSLEKLKKYYEINGERHTLPEWCRIYKTNETTVRKALKDGNDLETALQQIEQKTKSRKQIYTVDGYSGTIKQICDKYKIIPETIKYRMKMGMTLEEALHKPKFTKCNTA